MKFKAREAVLLALPVAALVFFACVLQRGGMGVFSNPNTITINLGRAEASSDAGQFQHIVDVIEQHPQQTELTISWGIPIGGDRKSRETLIFNRSKHTLNWVYWWPDSPDKASFIHVTDKALVAAGKELTQTPPTKNAAWFEALRHVGCKEDPQPYRVGVSAPVPK